MAAWKRVFAMSMCVPLMAGALITGCGDSGSSGGSVSTQPPGYNGLTTQAVITLKSASDMSKELFVQTQSQESLSSIEGIYLDSDTDIPVNEPPLFDKGGASKGGTAALLPLTKAAVSQTYTINGACGGTLTLETTIDTVIGFSQIEVTYDDFCYEGITENGTYTLSIDETGDGTYNGDITRTYTLHTVTEPSGVNRYEGDLAVTWAADNITRTFDYVVTNLSTGLGVQYVNFRIPTDITTAETTWTQAGRFYYSLYGYVGVETVEPFVAEPGLTPPHEGKLKMTGLSANGGTAFAWFEVFADGFQVTVDADGDGLIDGDTGLQPWGLLPLP
ncbi:hypothetical protein DSLASN_23910 [Desulfoluna limicola]|uniref:Lipoprotein n=1 Tax=Desulfoluna limicola TaxID=2810562 RepID=A0ABM7PHT0_9BACT|nr:hypothetical protein [Desulfoluna limicola]BCS96759.1 hypothetical protein DSLASN_23910 [Desulfoluna limicola]